MRVVNIHEAKTHLSRLLEEVCSGQEIIIAKSGKPLARLVGLKEAPKRRRLGRLAGQFTVPTDFNAPLSEEALKEFEGLG
jgi:prevent-host-death family protein